MATEQNVSKSVNRMLEFYRGLTNRCKTNLGPAVLFSYRKTAFDDQGASRNEGGLVACKVEGRSRDLFGFAHSSESLGCSHFAIRFFGVGIFGKTLLYK